MLKTFDIKGMKCKLIASWATSVFNLGLLVKDLLFYQIADDLVTHADKYRYKIVDSDSKQYICTGLKKRSRYWTHSGNGFHSRSPKKGTRFEKAVNYVQNHKDEFMIYLEDGRCIFSNNLSENSIRPFTVGRRNWLFSDTPKGADASSMVYTMVEMSKAHGPNIYKYLNFLLERLPGTVMTDDELSKLVP